MYRVWLEEVLGFKLRHDRLTIEPVIPDDWPGFTLTFRYGHTVYRIEVTNGGERSEEAIQLKDDGGMHAVRINAGRRSAPHLARSSGGEVPPASLKPVIETPEHTS
ncbi:MAG: glycosyl hydrolase family 65 protein [Acidobacteriota bacterium]